MEPSIPCGTTAKFGTHLNCVICRVGTYSNRYGKEQCMPCSLCSMGRTVTRNCSATKNESAALAYVAITRIMSSRVACLVLSVAGMVETSLRVGAKPRA